MTTDYVPADDGAAEVQAALDESHEQDTVSVEASEQSTEQWRESVTVPDNRTLDLSGIEIALPSNHNLSTERHGSRNVLYAVTNQNRQNATGVNIVGGDFDFSNVTDRTATAGVWLHRARDSTMRGVVSRSAGDRYGSIRCFSITITASEDCQLVDCAGWDGGYDGIGIRGANNRIDLIRCTGSGSSGAIQSAPWGAWNIGSGGGRNIRLIDCYGRRLYGHATRGLLFDGCESNYRLQNIGCPDTTFKNSTGFDGKVLIYTNSPLGNTDVTVENFEFAAGRGDIAIQIGTNGPSMDGTIALRNVVSRGRDRLVWFRRYGGSGSIGDITLDRVAARGTGSGSTIMSQERGVPIPDSLTIEDSMFVDFERGITGSYGTARVADCAFHGIRETPIDVSAQSVDTDRNTMTDRTDVSLPDWARGGGRAPPAYADYAILLRARRRAVAQKLGATVGELKSIRDLAP